MTVYYKRIVVDPKTLEYTKLAGVYRREDEVPWNPERWNGEAWEDYPPLYDASGINGYHDYHVISEEEAKRLMGGVKGFVTLEDDRVIFIEDGPGGGAGTAEPRSPFSTAAESANITNTHDLNGGVCSADLVFYKDDGQGVWKKIDAGYGHNGNSEVLAYRLNRLLGGDEVPETVYAEDEYGRQGTSQFFVNNATLGITARLDRSEKDLHAMVPKEQYDRVLAMDVIMYNFDRHDENWLLKEDPVWGDVKLIAIDHGHARWKPAQIWRTSEGERRAVLLNSMLLGEAMDAYGEGMFYKISDSFLSSWAKIKKADFLSIFSGIDTSPISGKAVDPLLAWENLMTLIELDGRIAKW
jgi:hypothetical protein